MDPAEESAVSEIFRAARIPWSQLDGRTQRNDKGKVVKLRLSPCLELEDIPNRIGDLSSLEEIYLFWASRRLTHLPSDSFDRLHNLRVLQLRWCQGIKELPKLCDSIEELVIEGCNDYVDFSSFRTAKRTWKRLRSLHIIQVGTSGVASLVEAFSTEGDCDGCDGKEISKEGSSRTSFKYFPSLTYLCLRHGSIDQMDLAKLWPFFRRCPCLTNIDLGNNRIASLENLARVVTTSETHEVPEMALRQLSIAGNPCCNVSPTASLYNVNDNHVDESDGEQDADNEEGDSDGGSESQEDVIQLAVAPPPPIGREKSQMQKPVRQDEHLLRIITVNPQLVSILVCNGNCENSINSYNRNGRNGSRHHDNCSCFQNSALYSPSVRHALDLNRCSRGKMLMGTKATLSYEKGYDVIPTSLSLAKWSLVLERAIRIFDFSLLRNGHVCSFCHNCSSEERPGCSSGVLCDRSNAINRTLRERQASVIYSLLQGPAFAARGNQYAEE